MAHRIGTLIDQLGRLKQAKTDARTALQEAEKKYNEKEKEVHQAMKDQGIEIGDGKTWEAEVSKNTYPSVTDWPKLYAYIKRNNAWDLLHRRVSSAAYNERREDGKRVPGIESFTKLSLNVRKKKR